MSETKLDRFLEKIAPGLAFKRAVNRYNLGVIQGRTVTPNNNRGWSGYKGGQTGRIRKTASGLGQSEEQVAGYSYANMVANAMQLYRDDPLTRSIVDVSGVYLGESRPTATTSDTDWNDLATEYFNEYWWPQADARGRAGMDFGEIQRLFDTYSWLGGDMLYLLYDGQLLPYEGAQIQTPWSLRSDAQIRNGIRLQKAAPNRISHYYIVEPGSITSQKFTRVRANEAIYAGSRNWRTAMLRAVPDLHSVIDALFAFNETNDNVAQRIRFESMIFTVGRKGAISGGAGSNLLNKDSSKGTQIEHMAAEYGMHLNVNGDPDRDFKFQQMTNPQSNYVNVMEYMARLLASGTGFPYEIVMHIYTSGSYTANRAARLDFAKALMGRWAWRNKVLNQRVWNWRIAKAVKAGELPPAPVNQRTGLSEWNKCAWTLPHFPHIDEGKEVVADIKQWGCGQESLADWAQQKGITRSQMLDAHDVDIKEMQARADTLGIPLEQYMGQLFTASAAPDKKEVI